MFSGCTNLRSVDIAEGVTEIGTGDFMDCSSLERVAIPDSVNRICGSAFKGCKNLKDVTLPKSLHVIALEAFEGCSSIVNIVIPEKKEGDQYEDIRIGWDVFKDCSSLKSIRLSKSVTEFETDFYGCDSLTSIVVDPENETYDSRNGCNAVIHTAANYMVAACQTTVIPGDVTGVSGFSGCKGITEITIPNGVTRIGDFADCSNLKSIYLPDSVTNMEGAVFMGCSSLISVRLPKGITEMNGTFKDCSSLESIEIPESVTEIGNDTFTGCSSLRSIFIPKNVTSIPGNIFAGCSSLESIRVSDENKTYDSRNNCNALINTKYLLLIAGCNGTKIPEGIVRIAEEAFEGSGIERVYIPKSVTQIGHDTGGLIAAYESQMVFADCANLKEIVVDSGNTVYDSRGNCNAIIKTEEDALMLGCSETKIPEGIKAVREGAFLGCSALESITIPDSVTKIYHFSFENCTSLESIRIPSGVERIGNRAFYNCRGLKDVVIPGNAGIERSAFQCDADEEGGVEFIPDLVIHSHRGTWAEKFANNNGITFEEIKDDDSSPNNPEKIDISEAAISLENNNYVYDGKAKTPAVTVIMNGKVLVCNTDYTVSYSNNIRPGKAKATATGKGNYKGSVSMTFNITDQDDNTNQDNNTSPDDITSPDGTKPGIICNKKTYSVAYGAKPFKLDVKADKKPAYKSSSSKIASVDKNGKVTIKGTGIAYITVKADSDSVKITIKVSPKKPAVKSVNVSKGKKLTVKWAKDKRSSGYQIQICTDKKFKKGVKSAGNLKASKTTVTFKKLKAGKKYYVRMRGYKKVGKTMLYSKWSSVKQSGKVKK